MSISLPLKLSIEDHELIKNYALKNFKDRNIFRSNGYGRQFTNLLKQSDEIKSIAEKILSEKMTEFGIKNWKEEPIFGVFIGVNEEQAFVHEHSDSADESECHLRLNFLIQKPIGGGMPILNGKKFSIEEGDCWINLANIWKHSSTPVVGNRVRIVLSVGALVSNEEKSLLPYMNWETLNVD